MELYNSSSDYLFNLQATSSSDAKRMWRQSIKVFTQTSNIPYERHRYKFNYANGTYKIFEYYIDAEMEWMQAPFETLGTIEVLDKKNEKIFDK